MTVTRRKLQKEKRTTAHRVFGMRALFFAVGSVFNVLAGVAVVGAFVRARFGAFLIAEFARAVSGLVSAWNIVARPKTARPEFEMATRKALQVG